MKKVKENKKTKVFVGISGGVDSSVSAAILKDEGYDVTGVFIKVWYPEFLDCDWKEEKRDAMRICAHLDIPFKMLDLSKEYKEEVIDYMIDTYKKGHTPNPDVMCNKYVKFGSFFDWAVENGADFMATGHYAQVRKDGEEFKLVASEDTEKDQTYFLWSLKQKHLEKTIFPIGKYKKEEVRKLAHTFGLFTESKKDSQGLCFLGQLNMKDFLKQYIKTKDGDVLNEQGEVVGSHDGAVLYTIGERHGFEIFKKNPNSVPLYVISKNIEDNTIVISENKPVISSLDKKIKLGDVNIISDINNQEKVDLYIRTKYRQTLLPAILYNEKTAYFIEFINKSDDVAVGQSIVFYKDSVCLGGGIVIE